jgi:hypothetical protein
MEGDGSKGEDAGRWMDGFTEERRMGRKTEWMDEEWKGWIHGRR